MTTPSESHGSLRPCPVVIPERLWRERERRHRSTVDELTRDHLHRRHRGTPHPVVDFLFTYYRTSVGTISRWHPGPGVILENAHHDRRAQWRHYRRETLHGRTGLIVDPDSVLTRGGPRLRHSRAVIEATASRAGATGCFGLHEWAMLYRSGSDGVRHGGVPLRITHDRIDEVVRGSRLRCTHFDAFRFFTEPARPLNDLPLSRGTQASHEQPACLHAGMDVYAYTAALEAGAPGELLLDTLRAAFSAREIDMRSSPYDLSEWGLAPIPVETPRGRAEFVAFQRGWITRTQALRSRYLRAIDQLEALSDRAVTAYESVPAHTG